MTKLTTRLSALLLACAICSNAAAQSTCRQEFALSYGLGSTSGFVAVSATVIAAIFGAELDYAFIGPIAGEYFYNVSDLVGVGAVGAFAAFQDKAKPGEPPMSCVSLLPGVKLNWLRRDSFGMYTKLCAGAAWFNTPGGGSTTEDGKKTSDGSLIFNFQASLLGAEFGRSVRGFIELGAGEQGIIVGGVRFRL